MADEIAQVETANRDLEDMDLLFSGDSVLAWRAERQFEQLRDREFGAEKQNA